MGKKRKNEDPEERIRRKIKRLNEKLKKHRRIIYSDEEDTNHAHDEYSDGASLPVEPAREADVRPGCSHDPVPDLISLQGTEPEPLTPQDVLLDKDIPVDVEATTESQAATEEVDLDADVLELLGAAPELETALGKTIHKDVAARWLDIIKKGLNKETKEKLAKDYLIPSNCELLIPPILNPEVKAALPEPLVKRDSSLIYRQKQLGNTLAALAPALEIIISKGFNPELRQKLLKPVNDACRILCDMYHNETRIRKKFVVTSVSTELKDTLVNSNTDKYLFGDNMSEKIKNAKSVQKSSEALKPTQKKPNYIKNYGIQNRKNFKSLHQKVAGKQDAGKSQPAPRHQQQSGRAPPRRAAPERSPPPSPPRRRTAHSRR